MSIEFFLNQQDIKRYQRLLDIASDQIQRRQIENLLAAEKEKTKELERLQRHQPLAKSLEF